MRPPPEPFGPLYPDLGASVAKFRRIKNPTWEQRQAHGEAVEQAIRALQRQAMARATPTIPPSCASGTWHNGGDYANGHADGSVGKAIRAKHRASLLACPEKVRKARTDAEWRKMYIKAMKAKHGKEWTYETD